MIQEWLHVYAQATCIGIYVNGYGGHDTKSISAGADGTAIIFFLLVPGHALACRVLALNRSCSCWVGFLSISFGLLHYGVLKGTAIEQMTARDVGTHVILTA